MNIITSRHLALDLESLKQVFRGLEKSAEAWNKIRYILVTPQFSM